LSAKYQHEAARGYYKYTLGAISLTLYFSATEKARVLAFCWAIGADK
jgi:hypothetical protein